MNQKSSISRRKRHQRIREGLQQNKSLSAIALELGCGDVLIQRDLYSLLRTHEPKESCDSVGRDVTAEAVLRGLLRDKAMHYIKSYRLPQEAEMGIFSEEVAEAGLKYLTQKGLVQGDKVWILDQVGRNLCTLGDIIAEPREENLQSCSAAVNPASFLQTCPIESNILSWP